MENVCETLYELIWCSKYRNVGRFYITYDEYILENNSKRLNRLYLKNKKNYTIGDIEYIIENSEIILLEEIKKISPLPWAGKVLIIQRPFLHTD